MPAGAPLRCLCSFGDPDGITETALRDELAEAAVGRSELLVIDVRSAMEIQSTGPIHASAAICENVPLDRLVDSLFMGDDEWEEEEPELVESSDQE